MEWTQLADWLGQKIVEKKWDIISILETRLARSGGGSGFQEEVKIHEVDLGVDGVVIWAA